MQKNLFRELRDKLLRELNITDENTEEAKTKLDNIQLGAIPYNIRGAVWNALSDRSNEGAFRQYCNKHLAEPDVFAWFLIRTYALIIDAYSVCFNLVNTEAGPVDRGNSNEIITRGASRIYLSMKPGDFPEHKLDGDRILKGAFGRKSTNDRVPAAASDIRIAAVMFFHAPGPESRHGVLDASDDSNWITTLITPEAEIQR